MKNGFKVELMLKKGIKYFAIFLLPVLIDTFIVEYPQWSQLTIGGLLVMVANYLKHAEEFKIPFLDK